MSAGSFGLSYAYVLMADRFASLYMITNSSLSALYKKSDSDRCSLVDLMADVVNGSSWLDVFSPKMRLVTYCLQEGRLQRAYNILHMNITQRSPHHYLPEHLRQPKDWEAELWGEGFRERMILQLEGLIQPLREFEQTRTNKDLRGWAKQDEKTEAHYSEIQDSTKTLTTPIEVYLDLIQRDCTWSNPDRQKRVA